MDAKIIQLFGDRETPVSTDDEDVTVDDLLSDLGAVQEALDNLDEYDTVERFWQGVADLKEQVAELPSGP